MFAPGPVGPRDVQGGTAQRRLYEGLWRTALALRCESTKRQRVRPRRVAHAKVARRTGCKTTARRAGHTGARVAAHESQTRTPQTPGPQDTILSYILIVSPMHRGRDHRSLIMALCAAGNKTPSRALPAAAHHAETAWSPPVRHQEPFSDAQSVSHGPVSAVRRCAQAWTPSASSSIGIKRWRSLSWPRSRRRRRTQSLSPAQHRGWRCIRSPVGPGVWGETEGSSRVAMSWQRASRAHADMCVADACHTSPLTLAYINIGILIQSVPACRRQSAEGLMVSQSTLAIATRHAKHGKTRASDSARVVISRGARLLSSCLVAPRLRQFSR